MRSQRIYYSLISIVLVLLFAGTSACQKDRDSAPAKSGEAGKAQAVASVADLLASMNMYHFTEKVEAPEFELKSLDGKRVSLSQYRGSVVLLSFWATW